MLPTATQSTSLLLNSSKIQQPTLDIHQSLNVTGFFSSVSNQENQVFSSSSTTILSNQSQSKIRSSPSVSPSNKNSPSQVVTPSIRQYPAQQAASSQHSIRINIIPQSTMIHLKTLQQRIIMNNEQTKRNLIMVYSMVIANISTPIFLFLGTQIKSVTAVSLIVFKVSLIVLTLGLVVLPIILFNIILYYSLFKGGIYRDAGRMSITGYYNDIQNELNIPEGHPFKPYFDRFKIFLNDSIDLYQESSADFSFTEMINHIKSPLDHIISRAEQYNNDTQAPLL